MICDLKKRRTEGTTYLAIQMSKDEAYKLLSDIDDLRELILYIETLSVEHYINSGDFLDRKIKEFGDLLESALKRDDEEA